MESPLPPNPYKTLNIAKDATLATIKTAHRKLVLTCHPDKFLDEAVKQQKSEQFHEVQQAYEILSDETKRQRYDERVKLAELRAEVMMEKGGSRIASESVSRSRPMPKYDVREDRIYEERVPNRSYEDDPFSAKFQEYGSSSKKYDVRYPMPASRRSSGRAPDESRKSREPDEDRDWERYDRQAKKDASRKANHGNKKKSDKDKRKDREAKFSSKSAYVEDETDSDVTERYSTSRHDAVPKRRHDDVRRRDREDLPRRSSRRDDSDTMDDVEYKTTSAKDYMEKSRRGASVEVEPRRPASGVRHVSTFDIRQPAASSSTIIPSDTVRRSSGRAREGRISSPARLSTKDRRMTEIVDPPSSDRRPAFSGGSSDPRGLKNLINSIKREPSRASTEKPIIETRQPFLRRAETMPSQQSNTRRAENMPLKSSRPKNTETNDSGYSSSGTPELYQGQSPQLRTTSYKINEYDDDPRQPVYREPDSYYERDRDRERDRDISPRPRRPEDRPVTAARASTSARGPPPSRTTSYAFHHSEPVQSPRQPSLPHSESSRGPPLQSRQSSRSGSQLFGEYPEGYKIVNQSRKFQVDDIRFVGGRDPYPSSNLDSRHHPNLSRHESRPTVY